MTKTRKVIAVFTALILTTLSALSFTTSADIISADNGSLVYEKYDAKTTYYKGSYTLSSMPSSDNSRAAIGDDTRYKDNVNGVVKLITTNTDDDKIYTGSGFVVSEHVIATAAHCVKKQIIDQVLLFDNNKVSLRATPVEVHLLKSYYDTQNYKNDKKKYEEDYALITVKEDLSDYMCFNLATPNSKFLGSSVKVTGFPGKVNNKVVNSDYVHQMYTGIGHVWVFDGNLMYHDADISKGNSGGPIYYSETYNGKTLNSVVGINTFEEESLNRNGGSKITFDMLHFYMNNDNINY